MKYYYTDSLKVAWMSDKFGVRFLYYPTLKQASEFGSEEPLDLLHTTLYIGWYVEMLVDAIQFIKEATPDRIYVHPDDYGVFEANDGDMINNAGVLGYVTDQGFFIEDNIEEPNEEVIYKGNYIIIQRNETAFFMPEVE